MLYSCLKEASICSDDLTNSSLLMCLVTTVDKENNWQATEVLLALAICDAQNDHSANDVLPFAEIEGCCSLRLRSILGCDVCVGNSQFFWQGKL